MKKALVAVLTAFVVQLLCVSHSLAFQELPMVSVIDFKGELEKIAVIDQKVMMPMRDGVRLCTDIYRPKTEEKVPRCTTRRVSFEVAHFFIPEGFKPLAGG